MNLGKFSYPFIKSWTTENPKRKTTVTSALEAHNLDTSNRELLSMPLQYQIIFSNSLADTIDT